MRKMSERRGPFTSPRLRGEVGSPLAIRVRGCLRTHLCLLHSLIDAPHPQPSKSELRSSRPRKSGAREQTSRVELAP
jgi:hypothetical protein